MIFFKKKHFAIGIITLITFFSVSYAESVIKVNLNSKEILAALTAAESKYAEEYKDNKEGISFIASVLPHDVTLLLLSYQNDDSDLMKLRNDDIARPAQLVLDAANIIGRQSAPPEIKSSMKIIHIQGNSEGIPTAGIPAGIPYHSVVIELEAAPKALESLVASLKEQISYVLDRSLAIDPAPRVHVTVGYVIGAEYSPELQVQSYVIGAKYSSKLQVQSFDKDIYFKIKEFIVDFPDMADFKNIPITCSSKVVDINVSGVPQNLLLEGIQTVRGFAEAKMILKKNGYIDNINQGEWGSYEGGVPGDYRTGNTIRFLIPAPFHEELANRYIAQRKKRLSRQINENGYSANAIISFKDELLLLEESAESAKKELINEMVKGKIAIKARESLGIFLK
jgi:hypothetical protein